MYILTKPHNILHLSVRFNSRSYARSYGVPLLPEDHIKRLNIFSKVCVSLSILAWLRALYDTKFIRGFDFGIISYAGSIISSAFLYHRSRWGDAESFIPLSASTQWLVLITHLIVASNHALGIYVAYNMGKVVYVHFAAYSITCTTFWLIAALCGWKLITNTGDIVQTDDTEMGDLYRFSDTADAVPDDFSRYGVRRGMPSPMR